MSVAQAWKHKIYSQRQSFNWFNARKLQKMQSSNLKTVGKPGEARTSQQLRAHPHRQIFRDFSRISSFPTYYSKIRESGVTGVLLDSENS